MKLKRHRVPHCTNCNRCKSVDGTISGFKVYYCCKDANSNGYGETSGNLGVDHPPKTSPVWCPLRENN